MGEDDSEQGQVDPAQGYIVPDVSARVALQRCPILCIGRQQFTRKRPVAQICAHRWPWHPRCIGGRIDPDGSWQAGDYGCILGEAAPFFPTFGRENEERQEQEFTTKLTLKSGVSWS